MKVIDSIVAQAAGMAAVRRTLHTHPELCFKEVRTAELVAGQLSGWGIPIHRGMGTTGVVGILRNGTSQRAIALRADRSGLMAGKVRNMLNIRFMRVPGIESRNVRSRPVPRKRPTA